MKNDISFRVNDGRVLTVSQAEHDGPVTVTASAPYEYTTIIPAGDMVQLVNLYRYTQRYDICDSFINPHGSRIISGGELTAAPGAVPPVGKKAAPLRIWFFLCQDGDGGYHIYRRPVDEFNPDPARREDINDVTAALGRSFSAAHGGALLSSWVQNQLVEVADLADFPLDTHD